MGKLIRFFSVIGLGSILLVACGQQADMTSNPSEKPTVAVTTSFLADIVEQLAGEEVTVETLIPAGEDPHVYVAKSSDLAKLSKADLVLYHGLHFEGKMIEALEQKGVAVSKSFPSEQLKMVEEGGTQTVDPHFWFDISLYKLAVEEVSVELQKILPEKAETIRQQTTTYLAELDALDSWITEQLAQLPMEKRYLITPHDAFNYFARAYQFELYAPQGVSTDSEVATKDMMETVDFILNHQVKAVFAESTTSPERMEKLKEVVESKGSTVMVVSGEGMELYSDSLAPKGQEGDTYIEMYKHNVSLIVEHLK